jgi:hypothetical protein
MRRQKFSGIIISHLGNIDGRKPELENTLPYVQQALKLGWHVCVDVVFYNGGFLLPTNAGHHAVPPALLSKQRVWCRASNPETMDALCNINAHCFLVSLDFMSLTSSQFLWTLPPHNLVDRSIAAYPELAAPDWLDNFEPAGLCSNEPARYI